jgi:exopolysaccharide biosynthesis protein
VRQSIHVLELDLAKVRLEVSPGDKSRGREFVAQTTSSYLRERGLLAAVNGGYFTPFRGGSRGGEDYYPRAGDPVDVEGASISRGVADSPAEPGADRRVNAILCIEGAVVEIRDGQKCAPGTDHAIAAGPRLLARGQTPSFAAFDPTFAAWRHPRTAVGLDAARKIVWLVVVDGRQPTLSQGASLAELAGVLRDLGAVDAINLDGGGSATLVVADHGRPRILNSPIHTGVPGRERPSANHLGVGAAEAPKNPDAATIR